MAVKYYAYNDASAPKMYHGTAGTQGYNGSGHSEVLYRCLVTGYGTKPAAGWSQAMQADYHNDGNYTYPYLTKGFRTGVGSKSSLVYQLRQNGVAADARKWFAIGTGVAGDSYNLLDQCVYGTIGDGSSYNNYARSGFGTGDTGYSAASPSPWYMWATPTWCWLSYYSPWGWCIMGFGEYNSFKANDRYPGAIIWGAVGSDANRWGQNWDALYYSNPLGAAPFKGCRIYSDYLGRPVTSNAPGYGLAAGICSDVELMMIDGGHSGQSTSVYGTAVDHCTQSDYFSRCILHAEGVPRGYVPGLWHLPHYNRYAGGVYTTINGTGAVSGRTFASHGVNGDTRVVIESSDWDVF